MSTRNQTLRRKCNVTSGDKDLLGDFNPADEWENLGQDHVGDLGTHCG